MSVEASLHANGSSASGHLSPNRSGDVANLSGVRIPSLTQFLAHSLTTSASRLDFESVGNSVNRIPSVTPNAGSRSFIHRSES
jgi:hypothetical protein